MTSNNDAEKNSGIWPVQVPKNMRTNRRAPRLIAIGIVAVWLAILYLGTSALARQQNALRTPLDSLLEVGSHNWTLALATAPEHCVGTVATDFTSETRPKLNLRGTFSFAIAGKPLLTSISAAVFFSEFRKLEVLDANVELPTGRASLKTNDDLKNMTLKIASATSQQQMVFAQPDPIYITERSSDKFSLVLPAELEALVNKMQNPAAGINDSLGFMFTPASAESVELCQSQLQSANQNPGNSIDITRFTGLFKAGAQLNNLGK